MSESIKPPVAFWIIAILALLWNLGGVMAYLGEVFMTEEMLSTMTPEQQEFSRNIPSWITGTFAIAVWVGVLGTLLLMLRRRLSYATLVISALAVIVRTIYYFAFANAAEVFGTGQTIFAMLIVVIAIALPLFVKMSMTKGWIVK